MSILYEDNLQSVPCEKRSEILLNRPESQWFERKGIKIRPVDIARPIIAFANAEGGLLVIGASNGKVAGLNYNPKFENEVRQAIHDYIRPHINVPIEKMKLINSSGDLDEVLLLMVSPSDTVYEDQSGKCFMRVGDDSRELKYNDRRELEYNKGLRQYDGEIVKDSTTQDLDSDLISKYCVKIGYKGKDPFSILRARFLLSSDNRQTNACHLLFSKHPQDVFPQASVRVTKFLADEQGVGAKLNIDSDNDYRLYDNIPNLIYQATDIIDRIITKRKSLGNNNEFVFNDIIPRDAWLEGLVNALVHRSYSLSGDYVHIEIYPTRIEVISPGIFPGLANTSDLMNISRFARNPRIARVCTELGFGQELGEGIKRIVTEMRKAGYIDPIYTQNSGNVKLRLEAVMRLGDELLSKLPKGSDLVLNTIRMSPNGMGTGEIMDKLVMSRPTISLRLKRLEEMGLVTHKGKSPTDPRAIWVLNYRQ